MSAQAIAYAMVLAAAVVPSWGQWYSQSKHHRSQVDSFLAGSLALGRDPARLEHDLAWSEGGVHQVWGLGVPLWRLPFEAAARLFGAEGFPDMLALAAALAMAAWAVLGALLGALFATPSPQRFLSAEQRESAGGRAAHLALVAWLAVAGGLVLLFPPFVNLFHTRFDIYEEVVVYEYLVGLGLIAWLIRLAQRPTAGRYWGLCALAGLGGLVRPTLVFHGGAAVIAGAVALELGHRRQMPAGPGARTTAVWDRWPWRVALGLGLFGLGGGLLYATNLARFGNGFEFGHRLNVQHLYGSLYATRFDHPFQQEPLGAAGRELFGLLFMAKDFDPGEFYGEQVFPGQSPTVRWREVYLTTYDLHYLGWVLAGWAAGAWAWGRLWRGGKELRSPKSEVRKPMAKPDFSERQAPRVHQDLVDCCEDGDSWNPSLPRSAMTSRNSPQSPEVQAPKAAPNSPAAQALDLSAGKAGAAFGLRTSDFGLRAEGDPAHDDSLGSPLTIAVVALYSALATVPLLGFYLRNGVISSRYVLDLMPAFAAAMLAAWLAWGGFCQQRRVRWWWLAVSAVLLAGWLGWQISNSRSAYGPPRVLTWQEVKDRKQQRPVGTARLPAAGGYDSPQALAKTGVPFNGAGWEPQTGRLMPCVIVFVHNPQFLELELVAQPRGPIQPDPEQIRAKIGLEYLQRESVEKTDHGWKIRFRGPRARRYQTGWQPVFLATVPNRHLADYEHTPWRLLRVRWREEG